MYIVIFESWPEPAHADRYAEYAARMLAEVESMEGFIGFERYASVDEAGKFLAISLWESQESIQRWRENLAHREAQKLGKRDFYRAYRLRVAEVSREYGHSN